MYVCLCQVKGEKNISIEKHIKWDFYAKGQNTLMIEAIEESGGGLRPSGSKEDSSGVKDKKNITLINSTKHQ